MFFHRINVNIVINLIFLLGISALLINILSIMSGRRLLIKAEIEKSNLIIAYIEDNLNTANNISAQSAVSNQLSKFLINSNISCILIQDHNCNEIYLSYKRNISLNKIKQLNNNAIKSGKKTIHFSGITWGVFWKQKKHMIISSPIYKNKNIIAGVTLVLPINKIYNDLRAMQRILSIYILINTLILTFIGTYRFSKIIVKPLKKLVKRAEKYKEDEDIFFLQEKGTNEFNQLSKALNRMVYRIALGKEELKATIHSLEKANIDLRQAQHDIINAEKLASVGRLSAGIAHEIGNPIAIVIGYLDLLKKDDIDEHEKKEFIIRTENEINRINQIIRQLLDFSRPSDGEFKKVSVHDTINDIINILKFQPLMSNIQLKVLLSAKKDIVKADPSQLSQIFLNLIINASDAIALSKNKSNGLLTIETDMINEPETSPLMNNETMLKIVFSDNGTGIPEQNIGNVFDPFYTTKEPGKGTGLGLSVCYMIIEKMGGKIKVLSEEDKGTSMIIQLPVCK